MVRIQRIAPRMCEERSAESASSDLIFFTFLSDVCFADGASTRRSQTPVGDALTNVGYVPEPGSGLPRRTARQTSGSFKRRLDNGRRSPHRRLSMRSRSIATTAVAALTLGAGFVVMTAAGRSAARRSKVESVDFAKVIRATSPAFDARLAPVSDAGVKQFRIPIVDATIEIAKGVTYQGWTFGGTVPGPVLRARVGDLVRVTVVNESPIPHSIDFHAARIPANVAYRMILPKDSVSFEFVARDAGAFMVHCGTPPVTMHIMQGMYLPIIIDPADGWGTKADKEFVLVQSEFYAKPGDSTNARAMVAVPMQPDWQAAMSKSATQ